MFRLGLQSTLFLAFCMAAWPAAAQNSRSGLISNSEIERIGLERSWFTNVEIDRTRGRIAYVTLYVSQEETFRVFEVVYGGGSRSFSERHIDIFGDPLGREGARNEASLFMDEMRDRGLEVELKRRDVPEITLLVQSDRAMLHAIDGETGRTLWAQRFGDPDYPSTQPAANDEHVAVVNGSTLYVMERGTGKLLWQKQTRGAPGGGPAISGNRVFVPMSNGELETYAIDAPNDPTQYSYSSGRAMIQPTISGNTISWPTDRGFLYIHNLNEEDRQFRLEAHDAIVAPSMHRFPDQLFASSIDGYVYAVDEMFGNIIWRFSTGQPMSEMPVVIMNSVYVATDRGGMYCVDADSGEERWWAPGISRFLASSPNRLYCVGRNNDLRTLDLETGGRISSIALPSTDLLIVNPYTDRIYLGSREGVIQCLHETSLPWPEVYLGRGAPERELPEVIQGEGEGDLIDPEPGNLFPTEEPETNEGEQP